MRATIEDETALREAFAARTGPGPGGPGACPAPERIYDAARGALPPGEVRKVVEHLAACPECAEEWRLAVALEEEARAAGAEAAAGPAPARRPWYLQPVRAAATVALALVAVAVVWTVVQAPEEEPVYRGEELVIRSLIPEGEALPRGGAVLRWTAVPEEDPEGTTYHLRVTTAENLLGSLAEAEGLGKPLYSIPPGVLESLPPGTELLWRVEARLEDGRSVASPTFTTPVE